MSPERPALRPHIEALPARIEVDGRLEPVYALRDPFKLAEGQVVLSGGLVALAALFDGTRTLSEAIAELERRVGVAAPRAEAEELVRALDQACLLEGPRLAEVVAEFARAPRRAPACIGSYPGEPAELREFLEAQYVREGGPGAPPRPTPDAKPAPVRALISPHIDLHRGGHVYAWCWREVAESCPAELFVVFGTSHTGTAPLDGVGGPAPLYALTRKTFDTPLGPVPTDVEVLERLLAAYDGPDDLFAGELHHRAEHSIEFQAVYLAHLFAGRRPVRILPVLCGALDGLQDAPSRDERFSAFHRALRAALAPLPAERVAFVAGIDLAHLGAQFHEPPVEAEALARVAEQDRETLRLALEERAPDAVHADIARDGDPRHICGHAPLVALVHALEGAPVRGELLRYDQWCDGASSVTFAAAVYRAEQDRGTAA